VKLGSPSSIGAWALPGRVLVGSNTGNSVEEGAAGGAAAALAAGADEAECGGGGGC